MNYLNRNRNLILLLLSSIINKFGDVFFDLFIIWEITIRYNNIMDAVYLLSGSILFRAVLAMFSGIIADRFDKKKLILFANLSSIIIILSFAFGFNYYISNVNVCLLLILANNVNNEIFYRSSLAMGAEFSDKLTFIRFQSMIGIANKIIDVIGSAIIGLLIALIPYSAIFLLDVLTFICSSLFVMQIHYVYQKRNITMHRKHIFQSVIADVKTAMNYIYKKKYFRYFTLIMFILNLAYGFIPNILPLVFSAENNNSMTFGIIKSAITLGSLLGLLLVAKCGNKVSRLFKISMIGCAMCMIFMILPVNTFLLVFLFLSYGFFDAITQPLFSYTISSIDKDIRSRVLGGIDTIILLSPSIGMFIGTVIMQVNHWMGFIYLAVIFILAFLLMCLNDNLNQLEVKDAGSYK